MLCLIHWMFFSRRYDELTQKLADPSVSSDPKQYAALMKEFREITPIVETYGQYKRRFKIVRKLMS